MTLGPKALGPGFKQAICKATENGESQLTQTLQASKQSFKLLHSGSLKFLGDTDYVYKFKGIPASALRSISNFIFSAMGNGLTKSGQLMQHAVPA